MEQQTLNLFYGIGALVSVAALLIVLFLQHRQISSLVLAVKTANENPALINAVKGATDGIPAAAFVQALSVVTTVRTFAATDDQRALADQLITFIRRIDKDPTNDPAGETPAVNG
jgi:hypothetical protein